MLLSFSNVLAYVRVEYHPTTMPVHSRSKLSATNGAPVADPFEYRSLARALQDLSLARPDLAYAV